MRCKNDKKYQICHHEIRFFKLKMHQNPFPPDPAGGAYDSPIPLPTRRFRRLELGAYASVLRPPQHKILATPVPLLPGLHYSNPYPISKYSGDAKRRNSAAKT